MNGKRWLGTILTASVFITIMAGVALADTRNIPDVSPQTAKTANYKPTLPTDFGKIDLNRFAEAIASLPVDQQDTIANLTQEWETLQEAGRQALGFSNKTGASAKTAEEHFVSDLTEEQRHLSASYQKRQTEIQEELRNILLASNLVDTFSYHQ